MGGQDARSNRISGISLRISALSASWRPARRPGPVRAHAGIGGSECRVAHSQSGATTTSLWNQVAGLVKNNTHVATSGAQNTVSQAGKLEKDDRVLLYRRQHRRAQRAMHTRAESTGTVVVYGEQAT